MDIDNLIADNMGLVYLQLHKFGRAYDDEAFSFAMEALMNAARTFDASKKVKFATYASVCIYNAVACYLRKLTSSKQLDVVSYEDTLVDTPDVTIFETLASDEMVEDNLLQDELASRVRQAIEKVISETSSDAAKAVIRYWRDSEFIATQCEIAKAIGVAQPTVSRVLSAFKYKVRLELEDYL